MGQELKIKKISKSEDMKESFATLAESGVRSLETGVLFLKKNPNNNSSLLTPVSRLIFAP